MEFIEFMVDCSILIGHDIVDGVFQRKLRIAKYRGSPHQENEIPFVVSVKGINVAFLHGMEKSHASVSSERLSTG